MAKPKPKCCGVEGCRNPQYRRTGVCKPHLKQNYRVEQLCEIEGCDEPVESKGKCARHYLAVWRRERGEIQRPLEERGAPKTHGVSARVTAACGKVLIREGRGRPNTRAAEILEEYARTHAA
ncbi:MAG TPA: hypothetical protein VMK12_29070 [Anaeromyxobacteraceae bacterium]|nr:hypothetical protein [Anaeromyxobacteraceae bacterium]